MSREAYKELKSRQEKEMNSFPMKWAFSKDQLEKGMRELGLAPEDTDKVYSIQGGGFYLKTDADALHELIERHESEFEEAISADKSGDGFIFEMFDYELGNHEYIITWDLTPTLDTLGISVEQLNSSKALLKGLGDAAKRQKSFARSEGYL